MYKQLHFNSKLFLCLMIFLLPSVGWGQKIIINEFYRGGTLTTTDEFIELLLTQDLTAAQLEGFYVGDAASSKVGKFSAYKFTNMGSIASTFKAGTILLVGGTTAVTQNTAYDPANGDWNIELNAGGSYLPNANSGNNGDIAGDDIVWVDVTNTGATISADGFGVDIGTATGTFTSAVNVNFGTSTNNTGYALNSDLAGVSNTANWTTNIPAASTTKGQPNGGANTTYIQSLRNSVAPLTPTVNLSVSTNTASEADQTVVTVTASASAAVIGDQTVNLAVTGTGITAGDYSLSGTTITIPGGSTSGSVTFTIVDDSEAEGEETAILTISNPSAGITLGSTVSQDVVITDNDAATLSVNLTSLTGFTTTQGTASASQSYTLTASSLPGDITITAPAGVQVSIDNATFSSSLVLSQNTTTTTLYARLTGASAGPVTGTITHVSGNLSANVDVSGTVTTTAPAGADVVISQVYGGGGNNNTTYKNDFIELYNRGTTTVDLSGWSVQYASSAGTSWQVTPLSGTIKPGGYYLIQQAAGTSATGGTESLPTPDVVGTIPMSATAGKVALVSSTTALSGACPEGSPIVDFVGFGSTACYEGTGSTPAPSNTTAAIRKADGATDTDNNAADFLTGTPTPRNSALASGPTLAATPTSLTGTNALYYVEGSGPDNKTFSVSGNKLTDGPGIITITSSNPAVFSVSPAEIPYTGTSLSASTVTVQLAAGLAVAPYSGTITLSGGGATLEVPVSGVVNSNSPFTPISVARAAVGQTFTIRGRVTVTNQLGGRQIYIQDETGGIVVYSGPSGPDFSTLVELGDLVEVSGPISVFNGFTEITGTGNFTIVGGVEKVIPEPKVITLNQLADHLGQLVKVVDASITPEAATFAGNTNYTIAAGGQTGTLRINANSPLGGAGKPANPVAFVVGIADRFVSGATTPGTNGLQLQPRILEDIPGATAAQDQICTVPGPASTLTLDQTLDIASWNMEFFGADAGTIVCPTGNLNYNDMGPTNEDLQQTNAITVLNKLNADIIAVQEMSDTTRLRATVNALPGSYNFICSDRFSYYFQDDCDQTPSGNPPTVFGPSSLAQKVCVIYNTTTVTPLLNETKALLDGVYNYPSGNGWSSGRLPFMFVADATIDGVTRRVHVVDIHAKSGSATNDYNRRKQDIIDLKAVLDAQYPDANLVLLGDFNDKLNGSIATGQVSSYQPFVSDATGYAPITLPLENQGCSTFNSSASFIDHIIVSNDLNTAYVSNSAYVLQPFSIPNYGNTTSDHNPIVARFDLSKLSTPITSLVATATPATICSNGTSQLTATITGGGAPYTYTWTGPGTIANANSATTQVSGLSAGPQEFTINVTDGYGQTASTVVTVTVNDQPAAPALTSTSTVQGSAEVELSAANCGGTLVWSGAASGSGSSIVVSTATPGTFTYSVQCQVGDCISESASVSVTIIPLLTATVSASPEAILTNQTTNLTATVEGGTAPYTLEWTGPGIITNADQATATVAGLTPGEQVFTVKVTDATSPTAQLVTKTVSVFVTQANREPITTTIPNQTATAGTTFSLDITTAFSDPDNDALTYTATGLPAGLTLTNGTISGMPTTVEVKTVTVTATDPGMLFASTSFTFTVVQGPLKMLAPTYNCEAGQLTVNVVAGNGNPIEYQIPSVSKGWESKTTYPIEAKHIGKELKIRARQRASNGKGWDEVEVSFTPTACSANSRIGLPEAERVAELTLTVLGNPVADVVKVEIRGAEGQAVQLRLLDLQGRIIEARSINAAAAVEEHTFDVQRQASGILLLQATTPSQQKLVKVLKR
jgi:hypothetical protein